LRQAERLGAVLFQLPFFFHYEIDRRMAIEFPSASTSTKADRARFSTAQRSEGKPRERRMRLLESTPFIDPIGGGPIQAEDRSAQEESHREERQRASAFNSCLLSMRPLP
jgi:hypothetical protein